MRVAIAGLFEGPRGARSYRVLTISETLQPLADLERLANLGQIVDLMGTFVAATTGAMVAIRKDLDVVGIAVLAFVAGTAGGICRDLLIGAVPPAAISSQKYLLLALAAAGITFLWYPRVVQLQRVMRVVDAAGLGLFAVAGTEKALAHGIQPVLAMVVGVLAAVGGGMLRDVLINEIPAVLQKRELYATAALAGTAVVVCGDQLGLGPALAATVGANVVFFIRLIAIRRGWTMPVSRYRDEG